MFNEHKKQKSILGIDRGSKYVGLAYSKIGHEVIFPIGYLLNDQMIFFNIADLLIRYKVATIVMGYPSKQKDVQEKIQKFITNLKFILPSDDIKIELMDEDYTSVQSGEIVSNFKKNVAEDTISAMLILQRRKENPNSSI